MLLVSPAALLAALDAVETALFRGGLQRLKKFQPDSTDDGSYTPEAWPKLKALLPRLKALETLGLQFQCDKKRVPPDDAEQELAELVESGGLAKLKELGIVGIDKKAPGFQPLRELAAQKRIEDLFLDE